MKKIISIITALCLVVVLLAGCSGGSKGVDLASLEAVPAVNNVDEYNLYQDIFFNDKAEENENKTMETEGVFATLYDAFNDVTRYYVWGNGEDKTKDWQWELKLDDTSNLPANGSLVTVKGTFVHDASALDKHWIINPEISVKTEYKGLDCDIDMTVMSGTLERVEMQNISIKSELFEGKTVAGYGRVHEEDSIQHPYIDHIVEFHVHSDKALPEADTMLIFRGTIDNDVLTETEFVETSNY